MQGYAPLFNLYKQQKNLPSQASEIHYI